MDDTDELVDDLVSAWVFAQSQDNGFDAMTRECAFIDDHTHLEWHRKDVMANPDGDHFWEQGAARALRIAQERLYASLEAEWREMDSQALSEAYSVIWNDLTQWGRTIQHALSDEHYWKGRKGPGSLRNRNYAATRVREAMTEYRRLEGVIERLRPILMSKLGEKLEGTT